MSFAIKLHTTKSKDIVPIVNDVPVHSLLNPVREAEVFATNFMSQLSTNPNVLILGLGFGYHVEEIERLLNLKHKVYQISVIEGISDLALSCQSYRHLNPKISVFSNPNPEDIFFNQEFCEFLLKKPTLVMHPVLYKLNETYYRKILSRRAVSDTQLWKNPASLSLPGDKLKWLSAVQELAHAEQ
jgi:hypothetical protein